jgi:predicted Zn-dependent protease
VACPHPNGKDFLFYSMVLDVYSLWAVGRLFQQEVPASYRHAQSGHNLLQQRIYRDYAGELLPGHRRLANAKKQYQLAANTVPHKFFPLYLLAKLYNEAGQTGKAIAMAKELLSKKVKVPSKAID